MHPDTFLTVLCSHAQILRCKPPSIFLKRKHCPVTARGQILVFGSRSCLFYRCQRLPTAPCSKSPSLMPWLPAHLFLVRSEAPAGCFPVTSPSAIHHHSCMWAMLPSAHLALSSRRRHLPNLQPNTCSCNDQVKSKFTLPHYMHSHPLLTSAQPVSVTSAGRTWAISSGRIRPATGTGKNWLTRK